MVALVGLGGGHGSSQFRASLEALADAQVEVDQAVFAAGALSQKFVVADEDLEQTARVLHEMWLSPAEPEPRHAPGALAGQ